eukprot:m.301078 g.301078  ORF g.301078 m.301078 type:complete len:100 (-) comp55219_c0_seq4:1396-1695(-)
MGGTSSKFTKVDVDHLYQAAADNKLSQCQRIVRKFGPDIITAPFSGSAAFRLKDGTWTTALHRAALNDRAEILEWFLQQQVDCDIPDIVPVQLTRSPLI